MKKGLKKRVNGTAYATGGIFEATLVSSSVAMRSALESRKVRYGRLERPLVRSSAQRFGSCMNIQVIQIY